MSQQLQQYIPVGLLLLVAIGIAAGGLLAPTILGKKRTHNAVKDTPYECGMPAMTGGHARFSVKFYLVAMLFILFDIEVVFFLGWAAVFRDLIKPEAAGGIGLEMLLGALVFLALLEVGHIYAWKKGARLGTAPLETTPDSTTCHSDPAWAGEESQSFSRNNRDPSPRSG